MQKVGSGCHMFLRKNDIKLSTKIFFLVVERWGCAYWNRTALVNTLVVKIIDFGLHETDLITFI